MNSMPLPRATSCFLRPSSPLPFHAQVSHSFPTDPFVSSAAGVRCLLWQVSPAWSAPPLHCTLPPRLGLRRSVHHSRGRHRNEQLLLESPARQISLQLGAVEVMAGQIIAGRIVHRHRRGHECRYMCGGDQVTHARIVHIRRALGMGVQNLRKRRIWTVGLLLLV